MPRGRSFVAAVAQAAPVWMDKKATTHKAISLIREAASQHDARIIAFPESFIPAFPYGVWHHGVKRNMRFYRALTESAVHLDDPEVVTLQAAAREAQMVVVMGITQRDGGSLYNSQLFIGADGALLGTRRKLKPTSAERLVWGEGDGAGLRAGRERRARVREPGRACNCNRRSRGSSKRMGQRHVRKSATSGWIFLHRR